MDSEQYWARRADERERYWHKNPRKRLKKNWPGTTLLRWRKSRKTSRLYTAVCQGQPAEYDRCQEASARA